MRVTAKIVWNPNTWDFIWIAASPVLMGCSSGGEIAQSDQQLQQAQTAMTNTLNTDYSTSFGEQQGVLANLNAKLNYLAQNPQGYTPQQLATATTSINENTATAAKQALGSAAAFAASHGGADVGNGAIGQIAGQIGSQAAQSKAQQLASVSQQNQAMKQQNFWNAISGLNSVGSQYGGAGGTAIGGATSTANSATNAGSGALAAKQAGWQNLGGVISGISGLVGAGAGVAGGFGGGAAPVGLPAQLNASTLNSELAPGGILNNFSG